MYVYIYENNIYSIHVINMFFNNMMILVSFGVSPQA